MRPSRSGCPIRFEELERRRCPSSAPGLTSAAVELPIDPNVSRVSQLGGNGSIDLYQVNVDTDGAFRGPGQSRGVRHPALPARQSGPAPDPERGLLAPGPRQPRRHAPDRRRLPSHGAGRDRRWIVYVGDQLHRRDRAGGAARPETVARIPSPSPTSPATRSPTSSWRTSTSIKSWSTWAPATAPFNPRSRCR